MELNMEYNSELEKLIVPEYGRHVQNLIAYNKTLEDKTKRQEFAEQVINLMHQMNPSNKNVLEYRNRLWKHYFMIAGYEIDVTAPEGITIAPVDESTAKDTMEYPKNESKFRHYGHNVKSLIAKAIEMEDGPIKDGFVETIAGFMKMAYKNWNREHYVSDEIVLEDLKVMSEGKLQVAENTSLDTLSKAIRNKRRSNPRSHGGRSNNNRHRRSDNNHKRRGGRR